MSQYFCISVRFLDGEFHGRGDGGEPEWPPSPLRVFQALVAAAAARWNERTALHYAGPALRWLEEQIAPLILAPVAAEGARYRLYVPDNVGDLVGARLSRGGDSDISGYRTEKSVHPIHIAAGAIHYLWSFSDNEEFHLHSSNLIAAARSITHLGWGIDLVVADAAVVSESESHNLIGLRWRPIDDGLGTPLRVPIKGTLDDLIKRYAAFLGRVRESGFDGKTPIFNPVTPLSAFNSVGYRKGDEPPHRSVVIFALRKLDDSGFRPFDPVSKQMVVAAMLRHAASAGSVAKALGWTTDKIGRFVLGHAEKRGEQHRPVDGPRLSILPLPSIEPRRDGKTLSVGSVRRVLIATQDATISSELGRIGQLLAGVELIGSDEGEPIAMLSRITGTDNVVHRYMDTATTWATVTPVILPGYDDPRKLRRRLRPSDALILSVEEKKLLLAKLDQRIEFLIRKSIRQAGFSKEFADHAEIEWQSTGFWPGTEPASRYAVPIQHRRFRRLHVRIIWRNTTGQSIEVPGPIALGGGRFVGLGLFAAFR